MLIGQVDECSKVSLADPSNKTFAFSHHGNFKSEEHEHYRLFRKNFQFLLLVHYNYAYYMWSSHGGMTVLNQ
jgi:hypothetical protein